jgi:copper ion binding protein
MGAWRPKPAHLMGGFSEEANMSEQTFSVRGMTCDHCVHAVTTEVAKLPGVSRVDVDLARGTVTVVADPEVEPAAMAAAVDEAGYEFAG